MATHDRRGQLPGSTQVNFGLADRARNEIRSVEGPDALRGGPKGTAPVLSRILVLVETLVNNQPAKTHLVLERVSVELPKNVG
jgi:hypothetical protein